MRTRSRLLKILISLPTARNLFLWTAVLFCSFCFIYYFERHYEGIRVLEEFWGKGGRGTKPAGIKRILFWTPIFELGLDDWGLNSEEQENCTKGFEFTMDRLLLESSDVVLFHEWDMRTGNGTRNNTLVFKDMPPTRSPEQLWLFFTLETPLYSSSLREMEPLRDVFNLTMSYRSDSDIYVPYSKLIPRAESLQTPSIQTQDIFSRKSKMVAWIASKCNTPSQRETLVSELKNYIPVDIYGACGSFSCSTTNRDNHGCYREIGEQYRFYLALENALCEDYVTEKLFLALDSGMVPVVYGGANYSLHVPDGSFIDAQNFSSVKALAEYLIEVGSSKKKYSSYFEWRRTHRVDQREVMRASWCAMCDFLRSRKDNARSSVPDLQRWWLYKKGAGSVATACSEVPEFIRKLSERNFWKLLEVPRKEHREFIYYFSIGIFAVFLGILIWLVRIKWQLFVC